MLFDWLLREGWIILSWWGLVTLAGVAVFPLCARLLGALPDRGYTLARAAGLLVVGFVYWLLGSFGFLTNSPGSIVLAWLLVLGIGLAVYVRTDGAVDWRAWWQENRFVIIAAEILFIGLLFAWAFVRAQQNGIFATEKPMELAFMSATMRSESFPPNDPWLSGYAISYYYFGYVLAAMLSMMSGVSSAVGFNMMITLLFALTGVTTFGVVYNLVRSRVARAKAKNEGGIPYVINGARTAAISTGLLGVVFMVLLSNFHVLLVEIPYQTGTGSAEYLCFWDMAQRQIPQQGAAGTLNVDQWPSWWWFRGARVINDRPITYNPASCPTDVNAVNDQRTEVIDEFPQFSFLLADVHPHVLALPFTVLVMGLAVNVLLSINPPTRAQIILYAVCIGALIFLNTWDMPTYLAVLLGAEALRRFGAARRLTISDLGSLVTLGAVIGGLGALFYAPFLIGFRSQLGGVLPNLMWPTGFQQYFLMFGPFVLLLTPFVLVEVWRAGARFNRGMLILVPLVVLGLLLLAMIGFALLASLNSSIWNGVLGWISENGGLGAVFPALVGRRFSPLNILTTIVLVAGITVIVGRLFAREDPRKESLPEFEGEDADSPEPLIEVPPVYPRATGFALLLVGLGLALTLIPEFVYLRDVFGTRMNTIFKLYYQAWALFSVAAAYAVFSLVGERIERIVAFPLRAAYGIVVAVVLIAGLIYPVFGIYHRTQVEARRAEGDQLTLDGGRWLQGSAEDYQAIMCLNDLVQGDDAVVAEAIGGSYQAQYGRVGALTGIPIVMGWPGHQSQWRGASYIEVVGSRVSDIPLLYQDPRWEIAREIISRYGIDYIFYGSTERAEYGISGEAKFSERLEIVCQRGSSLFYVVPQNMEIVQQP